VNVNLHAADHVIGLDPLPDYVNPRTFELAACGAFQLVDRREPLAALFGADEIAVFDTVAELRDKTQYYISRPVEARAIAERARQRTTQDHTYDARVSRILSDCLPAHLQPQASSLVGQTLDAALEQAATSQTLEEAEIYLRILADVREATASR